MCDDIYYRIAVPESKPVRLLKRDDLPTIEINGKIIEYDGLLDSDESLGGIPLGYKYPTEIVNFDDVALEQRADEKPTYYVNLWRMQENDVKYIFKGIFKDGCWTTDKNGGPMFSVSRMVESETYS